MKKGNIGNAPDLKYLKIDNTENVFYQLPVSELVEHALVHQEGRLSDAGALAADTGKFTGRSPKDRFLVEDSLTKDAIWWGDINQPMAPANFDALFSKVAAHLSNKAIYVRDCAAGADPAYQLSIRVITETAYQSIFANNLFLRPDADSNRQPQWSILAAPTLLIGDPQQYGIINENFVAIDFTKQIVLIAGTGYTGEIKKSIFSILNFILPFQYNILSMHCSANTSKEGDTALFFGLSGTGKTTLSADRNRKLIGDDEHGWSEKGIFNFEGGCYAKCVGLTEEKEPEIYHAIRFGSLLENVVLDQFDKPDYDDISKTENTRVSYPIDFMENAEMSGVGSEPKNIFFLTADAFGVLPPISLLTIDQAVYHFVSGYTAKVAGTEVGVKEPTAAFSTCFGQAFLPLHPAKYASLLRAKLERNPKIKVWLVNTGWIAGPYGIGRRIKLNYTRALIRAAMDGSLLESQFNKHEIFGLDYPTSCGEQVPEQILDARGLWNNNEAYDTQAKRLAKLFIANFEKLAKEMPVSVKEAGPKLDQSVLI
ncbi:phosphoenolpyruvate carboxykinase (ATP) [Sphingobacterium sp. N143]|uniref:phosphoenolpyruvate carboxykinase (ATP) n=1 Tax=Sphingobacterium sp. N143 TaxID=2746727 RepID=UPI002577E705|nr:phosphoenolpyruvate carboxykinase (ATP) [Sphingobacterium sp. N143]MDM1293163.1 phosphoenolpyruvate carboxykinase (ATP) [Sphingobacterium sp. N143]